MPGDRVRRYAEGVPVVLMEAMGNGGPVRLDLDYRHPRTHPREH